VTYIDHGLNSSSVELVHKFVVQPKFVELATELILAVELKFKLLIVQSALNSVSVLLNHIQIHKSPFS